MSLELLTTNYVYTVKSVFFGLKNNLASIADKGTTGAVVDKITCIINLNTDSYEARRNNFTRIYTNEKTFDGI